MVWGLVISGTGDWDAGPAAGYVHDLSSVVNSGDLGSCELHVADVEEFEYRLNSVRVDVLYEMEYKEYKDLWNIIFAFSVPFFNKQL